ncbi:MAG: hypothetical protein MJ231_05505 [bacterium]|nr:hypothetical protein [bacterium]
MRKNVNVIEIRGIRGLIIAGLAAICLFAGFIVFPGWVWMNIWNFITNFVSNMPKIGLFQGTLLWGIMIAAYFAFKKDKMVVCFKTPKGLSEDELKEVFANIKKQADEDPVLQAMLKARETELKLKNQESMEEAETSVEKEVTDSVGKN